uniref:Uncharacterized protein n=1 Tax=Zea mays TaxID=4577 RepID=A0A804PMP2_MAIZE
MKLGHPRKEEYFASDDVCLEDGILAIVKQGDERPLELLAKAYAIKSFDIDPQNPSDVVFTLEWESIGLNSQAAVVVAGWAALLLQLNKGRRAVLLRGVRWQKKGRRAVGIKDAERGAGSAGLPGSAVGSARAAGVVWGSWLRVPRAGVRGRAGVRSAGGARG